MIKSVLLIVVLMSGFITKVSFARQSVLSDNSGVTPVTLSENSHVKDTAVNKPSFAYPPATRDFKKLAVNTSIYLSTSLLVFGAFCLVPENVSGYKKSEIQMNNMFRRWREHIRAGPVIDNDKAYINYVSHPYCGAVYYMTARGCGFKSYECFLYSAAMSTFFWEYGVEAFAEVPSTQDLLITPIAGAAIGEGFFYIKKEILKHEKRVLHSKFLGAVSLFMVDPFNTILDASGYKQKIKTQVNISPAVLNNAAGKTYLRLSFAAFF